RDWTSLSRVDAVSSRLPTPNDAGPLASFAANKKCLPSGRKYGQPTPTSFRAGSACIATVTGPPVAGTRQMGSLARPSNKITPWLDQVPSAPPGCVASSCGGPPAIATFFSCGPAKNPKYLLSGDQNGRNAPSVPSSSRTANESTARTQSETRLRA